MVRGETCILQELGPDSEVLSWQLLDADEAADSLSLSTRQLCRVFFNQEPRLSPVEEQDYVRTNDRLLSLDFARMLVQADPSAVEFLGISKEDAERLGLPEDSRVG